MHRLQCKAQNYAWGKTGSTSLVARLLASSSNTNAIEADKPYAELWMGTHPNAPSLTVADNKPLKDLLPAGSDLTYLFKVLSIAKALSIQAHPDKSLAERLHAKDPAHYPDDNHKPELTVALTPFTALCCFRPLREIKWFLENVPEFKKAAPGADEFLAKLAADQSNPDQTATLKPLFASVYSVDATLTGQLQQAMLERLNATGEAAVNTPETATVALHWFRHVYNQFPNDVGCWMVFLLNIVQMKPGDGLFLAANEPHAYLDGDCVEIMAASDNVIRAGLTPKFKDVDTLVNSLTYRTDSLSAAAFHGDASKPCDSYVPPARIPEFRVDRVTVKKSDNAGSSNSNNNAAAKVRLHSPAIVLVMSGAGSCRCVAALMGGEFEPLTNLGAGSIFATVPPVCELTFEATTQEDFTVFVA